MFHYFPFSSPQYHWNKNLTKIDVHKMKMCLFCKVIFKSSCHQGLSHYFPFRFDITWDHLQRLNRICQIWTYWVLTVHISHIFLKDNISKYFQGAKEEVDVVEDLVRLLGGGGGLGPLGSGLQWGGGEERGGGEEVGGGTYDWYGGDV